MENGRREVLVVIPEPPTPTEMEASDTSAEELADVSDMSANDQTPADTSDTSDTSAGELSDQIQTTMLALHEDRIRRTDLAIMAYQQSVNVTAADARRAHRKARIAWGLAGGTVAATFVAIVWATHSVTRANAQVEHLNSVVRQLSDTADTRSREIEHLRKDAEAAHVAAARMDGELAAATRQADAQLASARPVLPF